MKDKLLTLLPLLVVLLSMILGIVRSLEFRQAQTIEQASTKVRPG